MDVCRDFSTARERLLNQPPDLLVTNVRLHEYNGLHLVHLATPHTMPNGRYDSGLEGCE